MLQMRELKGRGGLLIDIERTDVQDRDVHGLFDPLQCPSVSLDRQSPASSDLGNAGGGAAALLVEQFIAYYHKCKGQQSFWSLKEAIREFHSSTKRKWLSETLTLHLFLTRSRSNLLPRDLKISAFDLNAIRRLTSSCAEILVLLKSFDDAPVTNKAESRFENITQLLLALVQKKTDKHSIKGDLLQALRSPNFSFFHDNHIVSDVGVDKICGNIDLNAAVLVHLWTLKGSNKRFYSLASLIESLKSFHPLLEIRAKSADRSILIALLASHSPIIRVYAKNPGVVVTAELLSMLEECTSDSDRPFLSLVVILLHIEDLRKVFSQHQLVQAVQDLQRQSKEAQENIFKFLNRPECLLFDKQAVENTISKSRLSHLWIEGFSHFKTMKHLVSLHQGISAGFFGQFQYFEQLIDAIRRRNWTLDRSQAVHARDCNIYLVGSPNIMTQSLSLPSARKPSEAELRSYLLSHCQSILMFATSNVSDGDINDLLAAGNDETDALFHLKYLKAVQGRFESLYELCEEIAKCQKLLTKLKIDRLNFLRSRECSLVVASAIEGQIEGQRSASFVDDLIRAQGTAWAFTLSLLRCIDNDNKTRTTGTKRHSGVAAGVGTEGLFATKAAMISALSECHKAKQSIILTARSQILAFLQSSNCRLFSQPIPVHAFEVDHLASIAWDWDDPGPQRTLMHCSILQAQFEKFDSLLGLITAVESAAGEAATEIAKAIATWLRQTGMELFSNGSKRAIIQESDALRLYYQGGAGPMTLKLAKNLLSSGRKFSCVNELILGIRQDWVTALEKETSSRALIMKRLKYPSCTFVGQNPVANEDAVDLVKGSAGTELLFAASSTLRFLESADSPQCEYQDLQDLSAQ